jgi:nucleotide-binding universal stress UspA family protein
MFERKILVGVDGRAQGLDATALGVALARLSGAGVVLAHVYEPEPKWSASQRRYQHALRQHNHEVLEAARRMVPAGIPVAGHLTGDGLPAPALCGMAQEEGCDGLVIGSSHRGLTGRIVVGSTGELLLSGAGLPIAVAPPGFAARRFAVHNVIAAFDGSAESEAALRSAADVAGRTGARLKVMAVSDTSHLRRGSLPSTRLRSLVDEALARLAVAADVEVLEGDPASTLLRACTGADLILAGARGHGPLRDELPGAVSARLIRSCACPVIVMPRALAAETADAAAAVAT